MLHLDVPHDKVTTLHVILQLLYNFVGSSVRKSELSRTRYGRTPLEKNEVANLVLVLKLLRCIPTTLLSQLLLECQRLYPRHPQE